MKDWGQIYAEVKAANPEGEILDWVRKTDALFLAQGGGRINTTMTLPTPAAAAPAPAPKTYTKHCRVCGREFQSTKYGRTLCGETKCLVPEVVALASSTLEDVFDIVRRCEEYARRVKA